MNSPTLEASLREARVLVCAGTGGVGKTTIAAALAIQAALLGRRTLVLTIDPARRLADALGLESLGSRPTAVDLTVIGADQSEFPGASLDAMMLDAKPTFDRLITRLTPDEEARQRIFDNRIYEHLSSALAGSAEYAAMEQVHELVQSRRYDLIVVDTPPADHALDFLRAPRRLREFLESRFVHTLVEPAMSVSRISIKLFGRPLHRMLGLLERIAGVGFLDDLTEFLRAIDGLSSGFRERATRVEQVLLGEETGFILISSAGERSQASTLEFMTELEKFHVPLVAVIVNRVLPWPLDTSPLQLRGRCTEDALARDEARLAQAFTQRPGISTDLEDSSLDSREIIDAVMAYAEICSAEQRSVEALTAIARDARLRCHTIAELPGDIDRIDGLLEIGAILRDKMTPSRQGEGRRGLADAVQEGAP
jgi:anion-transporting  ArsA/GET3 family ATPase